ncbi:MAG TPA: NAD-glutamate dehydrogenase domain-containing protein [Gammaproteobacteria bacterium]|nr:NAD-glutamate dehydrogenase domain-containing protein [Gammaproteobacteria bacterium]
MTSKWNERLQNNLLKQKNNKTSLLIETYGQSFPHSYRDEYSIETALSDINYLELLSKSNSLHLYLYKSSDKQDHPIHLRLFQWQQPIPLSNILPMLENFDLRTFNEHPHEITLNTGQTIWISDFSVEYTKTTIEIDKIANLFQNTFIQIYTGHVENDGFNKLVLGASLSWRAITILRTYAKYLHQIRFRFSQAYIEKTLVNYPCIAKNLVDLFITLHNPEQTNGAQSRATHIEQQILQMLESVPGLDEDYIIKRLLHLIKATLRTNYFQLTADDKPKDYLAIKLNSSTIPELPLPMPLYEIFVYSSRFEAIHLRNTKIARGGIRWSDRIEDFRTEVLGLMKAQKVKNAIIVPSGAKGGFVLKHASTFTTRETLQAEVIHCYQSFIRGLLDLTDNINGQKINRPKNVVCHDDIDPYLVVAADKGTATFSDIANQLAKEYDFWLGDAFASGGATGYDHKKIGITARGAWESIKRHFRELDIDVNKTDITVVGIGDMSGDVFGNGMIYSKHIKLIAVINHHHIFLDPNPKPKVSYHERVRLFHLPLSSWEDYNPKLISTGGGVFKRSSKTIPISREVKAILNIKDDTLTPNELIRVVLKAPVDLLFNGGIGTYIKASTESDIEVGDRANDYCRVNGSDLQCKVVAEGGNLGFTQLGRVEYALKGGLINTDFIDNSAGVDCSDHEVNLKILLNQEVKNKRLSEKKRNALLTVTTQEVASLVLQDNYNQALIMSLSAFHAKKLIGLHQNYIKELENQGILNRHIEYLPDDKKLLERKTAGLSLTRPELAILLAYTKIYIKHEILKSDLCENNYLAQIIDTAFPSYVCKKFKYAMKHHRLHRDIIATQLSNQIVNEMGITFVYRLQMETGAKVDEIIRAYMAVSQIFDTKTLHEFIEELDFKISTENQYEIFYNLRQLINLATRWFLHSKYLQNDLQQTIRHFSSRVKIIEKLIPELMGGLTKKYLESITEKFISLGLPQTTARHIATYRAIYASLNIIDVATQYKFDLIKTAKVYFIAGERINLLWFRDQLANDTREGHWNTLARLTLRDELDFAQRALTVAIIIHGKKESDITKLIEKWTAHHHQPLDRWNKLLAMLHESNSIDYTMFFITIKELLGLIQGSFV